MKRKAEITFEEQETVILRQGESYLMEYCPRCQATVRVLAPEIMAVLLAVSEREVFQLIESGQIYFVEKKRMYACPGCCEMNEGLKFNE
jgi:phage FluMu protein Com